jgi:hypothetical protein
MFDFLVAEKLQARVAVPYIQEALDDQCPNTMTKVDPSGIVLGSIITWESKTTSERCVYTNEWECDCG